MQPTPDRCTVVGVAADEASARKAVAALREGRFAADEMSVERGDHVSSGRVGALAGTGVPDDLARSSIRDDLTAERTREPSSGDQLSVLVVEDDAGVRTVLAEALGLAGYRVCLVPDGLAALDAVRREPPDVVIVDLGLPVLDGQEFLDAWRTVAPSHTVPILVLSATSESLLSLARLGALRHVTKPFDIDAVVRAVDILAAGPTSITTGTAAGSQPNEG